MKGPLTALREGGADLHRAALALAKSAQLLPAVVMVPIADGMAMAARHGLTQIAQPDCAGLGRLAPLAAVVSARLPLAASEAGRLHVFRPDDGGAEHYAIEIGRPNRSLPVLTRLHSACFTGDVLGSLKCDCGPQLHAALAQMATQGAGVLLYLNQEGRGIGPVSYTHLDVYKRQVSLSVSWPGNIMIGHFTPDFRMRRPNFRPSVSGRPTSRNTRS